MIDWYSLDMMHHKRFISVKYLDIFIHPHHWMNHDHLYRGLELTRYQKCRGGTMLSQTGPLTGILWNLMPLNRISLLNKEFLQFHIWCQLNFINSLWLNLMGLDHVQKSWALAHAFLLTSPLTRVHWAPEDVSWKKSIIDFTNRDTMKRWLLVVT